MSFNATAYRILIASPGDVDAERDAVTEQIHAWNAAHSVRSQAVLLPVRWETHATPDMSDRAQGVINTQLVSNCDVLIGLFWTRLGTPTGVAESGTAEEIKQFMDSGRRVLLYFSSKPVALESVDLTQYQRLQDFKKSLGTGLTGSFGSVEELRQKLSHDLVTTIDAVHQIPETALPGAVEVTPARPPVLSNEAKTLLVGAAKNKYGNIMYLRALNGIHIHADRSIRIPHADRRSAARWEAAISQLVTLGLVSSRGDKNDSFVLTARGFEVADELRAQIPENEEEIGEAELDKETG